MKRTTSLPAGTLRCGDANADAEADANVEVGAGVSAGAFPGSRAAGEAVVMLSGPHYKFADGVARGLTGTDAYLEAYPNASRNTAHQNGWKLRRRPEIQAEIARIRKEAEEMLGSAKMAIVEKRGFLARVVRARVAELPADSDLWHAVKQSRSGTEYKLPDKLRAIKLDNDLAGEGSEAQASDALTELLLRVRK